MQSDWNVLRDPEPRDAGLGSSLKGNLCLIWSCTLAFENSSTSLSLFPFLLSLTLNPSFSFNIFLLLPFSRFEKDQEGRRIGQGIRNPEK